MYQRERAEKVTTKENLAGGNQGRQLIDTLELLEPLHTLDNLTRARTPDFFSSIAHEFPLEREIVERSLSVSGGTS